MQACAGTFADGIQAVYAGSCVQIDLYTTTKIVCCRCNGDVVLGYVNAQRKAFLVDVGEVAFGLFGVLVGDIEIYVVIATVFHLVVDSTCHNVARCKG